MIAEYRFWVVIASFNDWPLAPSLAYTRTQSIKNFLKDFENQRPWRYYRRKGYRCEKVTLVDGWKVTLMEGWE